MNNIEVVWTYKNGAGFARMASTIDIAATLYWVKCNCPGVVSVQMYQDGVLTVEFKNNYEKA